MESSAFRPPCPGEPPAKEKGQSETSRHVFGRLPLVFRSFLLMLMSERPLPKPFRDSCLTGSTLTALLNSNLFCQINHLRVAQTHDAKLGKNRAEMLKRAPGGFELKLEGRI